MLRHSRLTLAIALATLGLSVYLFSVIPKGFFPQQDTGRLMGAIQADQDTSFQSMRDRLTKFVGIIKADPAVDHVIGFAGGNAGSTNSARMFIALKPLDERNANADQVIARLRKKTSHIAGATLYLQATQDLRIGGRSANALYQYTLQGSDLQELNLWAPRLLQKMRGMKILTDVNSDQQNGGLEAYTCGRSRHGVAPRALAAGDRRYLVRRFRPAPGVDHVYAIEPISRGDGSRAEVLAKPGFAYLRSTWALPTTRKSN